MAPESAVANQSTNAPCKNAREAAQFLYDLSLKNRNFEISQLSARNNFFIIFQGVIIASLLQLDQYKSAPIVSFLVCACGFVISILQAGMASGAKFWQEAWEVELKEIEGELKASVMAESSGNRFHPLFSRTTKEIEDKVYGALNGNGRLGKYLVRRYSVSKIPIYSGIVFAIFWLCLLFCSFRNNPLATSIRTWIVGFHS